MLDRACQQITRLAVILAVALLFAQTMVVIHDHEPVDGAICAVCSTSSDTSGAEAPLAPAAASFSSPDPAALPNAASLRRPLKPHLARAPPTA